MRFKSFLFAALITGFSFQADASSRKELLEEAAGIVFEDIRNSSAYTQLAGSKEKQFSLYQQVAFDHYMQRQEKLRNALANDLDEKRTVKDSILLGVLGVKDELAKAREEILGKYFWLDFVALKKKKKTREQPQYSRYKPTKNSYLLVQETDLLEKEHVALITSFMRVRQFNLVIVLTKDWSTFVAGQTVYFNNSYIPENVVSLTIFDRTKRVMETSDVFFDEVASSGIQQIDFSYVPGLCVPEKDEFPPGSVRKVTYPGGTVHEFGSDDSESKTN